LSRVTKSINLISKRNQVHKMLLKQSSRNFATNEVKTTDKGGELQQKEQFLQFSKSPIQDTFGDLPFGEIPEPLKYVRPF